MPSLAATVDLFQLLGEPTRVRLLALLADRELTVADLTAATGLGQSSVSTHLARLRDAGLVVDRKAGSATLVGLAERSMPAPARRAWELLRGEVDDAVLERDRRRCQELLDARARRVEGWPDAIAGHMERTYSPGRTWEALARALVGLLELGDVLDAGAGDGAVGQLLAPRARSVTLVDRSERMIAAARERLAPLGNVTTQVADLHDLPFAPGSFDLVLVLNVLTEVERPETVVSEAHRVLRPGGRLALNVLEAHDHQEIAAGFRHVHPGFAVPAVKKLLVRAGFAVEQCEVTSQEKRPPRFRVITAFARKPAVGARERKRP
jgi:SAM-dependent methyltransferase/biotin operon repressor